MGVHGADEVDHAVVGCGGLEAGHCLAARAVRLKIRLERDVTSGSDVSQFE